MFKGVASLKFDEVVCVLLDVLPVHEPLGKLQYLDLKVRAVQERQRFLRGDLAGVVVVVAEHKLLGVAAEQLQLLARECRSHRGADIVEARLMEHDNIDVALDQYDIAALALFGKIQPV